ncbi:hypothetical protein [Luteimonas sp. e5]
MSLPAQAFAERALQDLTPGQLFSLHGHWALRVELPGTLNQACLLLLEGERAGQIFPIGGGIARSLCVVSPFGWFPAIEGSTPLVDTFVPASLALSPSGVLLPGVMPDGWGEAVAFGLDGMLVKELRGSGPHFQCWTIELHHQDRPFRSLGTIATIARAEPAM